MTQFDYAAYLTKAKVRAKLLQPATAEATIRNLDAILQNVTGPQAETNRAAYLKLIEQARGKDVAATAELAALRIIRVDNFMRAKSNVMQFFDTVVLAPNETPYIENTSKNQITVSYVGQDGRARRTQGIKYQEQAQVQLYLISSEEFEYTLKDLYKGSIADECKATVDVAWDLDRQVETLTWPYLQQQIGAFTLTGSKASRTYVPHSSVNVNNLPTTNLLVVPGNTTSTLWRKECFDVLLKYARAWGDAWPDGGLSPVAVYVPSSEVMGFLDQITLTSFSNPLTEQIIDTGFVYDYGGVKWTIIPDVTLDPKAGIAYCRFNKSVGTFFTKPFMDDVIIDQSTALRKQNKESMAIVKAVGWGLPSTSKVYVAAVKYHDTVS